MIPSTYRKAAVECASPIGLVIVLYDTLVGDIRQAIEAMNSHDLDRRCQGLHHGFQILQQLEGGLNMEDGGETARDLAGFYNHLRAKMLEAQFKQSVDVLRQQIALILEVRAAWQKADAAMQADQERRPPADLPHEPDPGELGISKWTV